MPSSTSNFERPVVAAPWGWILGSALIAVCLLALGLEIWLAQLGYRATALDSPQRWAEQRARVDGLGKRALVLIGASRIQLGIDLEQLRRDSHLEPVQLAVDGSSFVPVLEDLANDPNVTGTIMIDYAPEAVMGALSARSGKSEDMVEQYRAGKLHAFRGFSQDGIEQSIASAIREHLRSCADGATPWLSFVKRAIPELPSRQFLVTRPHRSHGANYGIAPMPQT